MSNKITFSDLVERIAEESGTSKRVIHDFFKEMVTVNKEGLLRDGQVYISGLGTFKLKWRDARQGINPQTGEPIEIPAQNRVYFKPEAALRRFINQEYRHEKPEIIGIDRKPAPSMPTSKDSFFRRKRAILGLSAVLLALLLLLLVVRFPLFRQAYEPAPPLEETTQPETIQRYKVAEDKEAGKEKQAKEAIKPDVSPAPETAPTPRIAEDKEAGKEKQAKEAIQPDVSPAPIGIPGGVYDVQAGNSLWSIAKSFYTDPYLWPNIFRVNTDVVGNPDVLEVGLIIHVPSLEGTIGGLSKNDVVNIVDGYMQAYLAYRRLGKRNAPYYLWVAHQYNVPQVLEQYEEEIDESDRDFILRIKGSPRI
jgi:nucleoid DNA-binding protein/LysM repeat protein